MKWLLLILGTVCVMGCASSCSPPPEPPEETGDYLASAYCKWGNAPTVTTEWLDDKSQYDFIGVTSGAWYQRPGAQDSLRSRNPDIHLGQYFPTHSLAVWHLKAYKSGNVSIASEMWERVSPYLVYTTEGDTASIFAKTWMFDFTKKEARMAMISVFQEYGEGIDWLMVDFFSFILPYMISGQAWERTINGKMDMDQDGIDYWNDMDEQIACRQASYDFAVEMREAFPDYILIVNGDLAIQKPDFRAFWDGCYIEGCPRWFFGSQNKEWINFLNPFYPHGLWQLTNPEYWYRKDKAHTYLFLEDMYDEGGFGYVSALFDNAVELKIPKPQNCGYECEVSPDDGRALNWLGAPLNEAAKTGENTYSREFVNGTITVRAVSSYQMIYSASETGPEK